MCSHVVPRKRASSDAGDHKPSPSSPSSSQRPEGKKIKESHNWTPAEDAVFIDDILETYRPDWRKLAQRATDAGGAQLTPKMCSNRWRAIKKAIQPFGHEQRAALAQLDLVEDKPASREATPPPGYNEAITEGRPVPAPTYEPFDFAAAESRALRSTGVAADISARPGWHAPPVYQLWSDGLSTGYTFHLTCDTQPVDEQCICSTYACACGARRSPIWHSYRTASGVALVRWGGWEPAGALAYQISRSARGDRNGKAKVRNEMGETCSQAKRSQRHGNSWVFSDLDGDDCVWYEFPSEERMELVRVRDGTLLAVYRGSRNADEGGRLEMTAFPHARMPHDTLACDYQDCSFDFAGSHASASPLWGFVFRCQTCTEEGPDSFDVCEPHLEAACAVHDPSHRFFRIPRPGAALDDALHEVPIMRWPALKRNRAQHELVISTLGLVLGYGPEDDRM